MKEWSLHLTVSDVDKSCIIASNASTCGNGGSVDSSCVLVDAD